MTSPDNQFQSPKKEQYVFTQPMSRSVLYHRTPVALALVYYIWILYAAWSKSLYWSWSLEGGVIWTSGGPGMFFPLPLDPGWMTVLTPANIIDQIFYLVFMHSGIWILLGILYVFSPYRLNVRIVMKKLGMRKIES